VKAVLRTVPFGALWVLLFVLMALFGPLVAPYNPEQIDLLHSFEGPSSQHWLGTGDNGVDILSLLLCGARLGGTIALAVVLSSLAIGLLVGMIAGAVGGRVDQLLMGVLDWMQAFPGLVLNLAILALVAEPSIFHVVLALTTSGWVIYARLARAQTLLIKQSTFIEAARALGLPGSRILSRHILPNILSPLIVQATAGLGGAVLAESTLSFLGLGPGKNTSWGALLDQGSMVLLRFPHVALIAGTAITLTVLGFNLCGDWLRDRFAR